MVGRLALLALLILGWPTTAPAQGPASIAEVTTLVGAGTLIPFGSGEARALAPGTVLHEGDRIQTAAGARLRIEFVDGTVMQLGETTDLVLEWFLYAPDTDSQNVLLRVSSGIFRVILDLVLPNAAFEVQTATAAATVRGTDWITEATAASTAIVALSGEVAVRSVEPAIGGTVVLGPGEGTAVPAGAAPNPVAVWGDVRRESFVARTSVP